MDYEKRELREREVVEEAIDSGGIETFVYVYRP